MAAYKKLLLNEGGGIIPQISVLNQSRLPCLLIGIGGTGMDVLRQLKKDVFRFIRPDYILDSAPQYTKFAFLGIDTDLCGITSENLLHPEEFFSLAEPYLGAMLGMPSHLPRWMSEDISRAHCGYYNGTGAVRQVGRFCLFRHIEQLYTVLTRKIQAVTAAAGVNSLRVHIFTGLSGGTGGGCFLDVCYLLRKLFDCTGIHGFINSYCFLPDTQFNRPGFSEIGVKNMLKVNGYAALRELEHFMKIPETGDTFEEEYTPELRVFSQNRPMDLCCLISGCATDGTIISYQTAVSTAAKVVLAQLAGQPLLPGAVGEWHYAGGRYCAIGAVSTELPLTEINTYLAASLYQKLTPSLCRPATENDTRYFADSVGLSVQQLMDELTAGCEKDIAFGKEIAHIGPLNDDPRSPSGELYELIMHFQINTEKKLQENSVALSRSPTDYDIKRITSVQNPSILERVFLGLIRVCMDSEKGPTVAADLLYSHIQTDLNAVLDEIFYQLKEEEACLLYKLDRKNSDVHETAHRFNTCIPISRKRKLLDYLAALQCYYNVVFNLKAINLLLTLIPVLQHGIRGLYERFFGPLSGIVSELESTFSDNRNFLRANITAPDFGCRRHFFELEDIRAKLDHSVLTGMVMAVEHSNFMNILLQNYIAWSQGDKNATVTVINDYMVQRFQSVNFGV